MGYNSRAVTYIKSAKENFKGVKNESDLSEDMSFFSENVVNFLMCTFLRKQGDFRKAANMYKSLKPTLDNNESEEFQTILTSSVVLLLNYDRKLVVDSFA
jgi:hypothetical protein